MVKQIHRCLQLKLYVMERSLSVDNLNLFFRQRSQNGLASRPIFALG
ncbi:hypothetical protein [Nostoc linckia]|nr:hypothetical protein [Nostoc linckia]